MRVAKVCLMFSLSVFLVAAAWDLLHGESERPFVRDAYATVTTDPVGPGQIVGLANQWVLTAGGEVWLWHSTFQAWVNDLVPALPVPVTQVAFVGDTGSHLHLVDTAGNVWQELRGESRWENLGPPPSGPVPLTPSTLSDLKQRFRDNEE